MKNDIKNKKLRECQAYVPASVEVIMTSVQRVICTSGEDELNWGIDELGRQDVDW